MWPFIAIIASVIAVIASVIVFKKKNSGVPHDADNTKDREVTKPYDRGGLKNINTFQAEKDELFSPSEFTEKVSNLYIRLCNCIEDKDILGVKPYFSNDIMSKYENEINKNKNDGLTHIFEKLTVLSVNADGWKTEGNKDIVLAVIRSRMTDYKVDSSNKPVTKGADSEKFITSEWILERDVSRKTPDIKKLSAGNCPNCGGVININSTAVCPYCGSVLETDRFNWKVTEIKTVSVDVN